MHNKIRLTTVGRQVSNNFKKKMRTKKQVKKIWQSKANRLLSSWEAKKNLHRCELYLCCRLISFFFLHISNKLVCALSILFWWLCLHLEFQFCSFFTKCVHLPAWTTHTKNWQLFAYAWNYIIAKKNNVRKISNKKNLLNVLCS